MCLICRSRNILKNLREKQAKRLAASFIVTRHREHINSIVWLRRRYPHTQRCVAHSSARYLRRRSSIKEFYRMGRAPTLVAARYVRNSDPSKKDSEVLKAQSDALLEYGKKKGYECPDHLLYADAISALKYPYWERRGLMRLWDDAERGEFDVVLVTEFIR